MNVHTQGTSQLLPPDWNVSPQLDAPWLLVLVDGVVGTQRPRACLHEPLVITASD